MAAFHVLSPHLFTNSEYWVFTENIGSSPNIANAMLAAGWIYVKERMPQDVTPVLVFGYCCDVCHNVRIAEYEVDGWWESFHGTDLHFEPEYWMPLPVPEGLACR